MTQEDKQLLLKDLSARLPYGVTIDPVDCGKAILIGIKDGGLLLFDTIHKEEYDKPWDIEYIKPYLRPMSSMTEEEKHELLRFGTVSLDKDSNTIDVCCVGFWNHAKVQDYLNSIHIDYRGLIPKGLAIEVTEENNPYKE